MIQVDYLLIGQGLAGSVLAHTLDRAGKRVAVIDQPALSACSRVAAGIYNPFSFKRLNNTWWATTLTPYAKTFYSSIEQQAQVKIHHEIPVQKIFSDAQERKFWERHLEERPSIFVREDGLDNPWPDHVHAPFGLGSVHGAGRLDIAQFLNVTRAMLHEKHVYSEEIFRSDAMQLTGDGVIYDNRIAARFVISCAGIRAVDDAWFSSLPLIPMKGQVLELNIPNFPVTTALNRGCYLVPTGNDHFLCGATYDRELTDETPTAAATAELSEKLQKIIRVPFTVTKELAGVRPTVRDRKPLLGRHPDFPQVVIFNGMGTKGSLLAPWLAQHLVQHLEQDQPLDREVYWRRFKT